MDGIIPKVPYGVKRLFLKNMRRCRDAGRQRRYLVILNLLNGRPASEVAEVVRMIPGSVYRIARRFSPGSTVGRCSESPNPRFWFVRAHFSSKRRQIVG